MLDLVIEARAAALGAGMEVKRILPFRSRRMVGPFIFMDHGGPVKADPQQFSNMDVLPHPHIGLSTVSYLFGGQITHRDSLGVQQIIKPGEVNWMTAGKGIAHSERFEDPSVLAAGNFELIQTWVALPEKDEESDPTFINYQEKELPVFTDKGVWMRLIAGDAYGLVNKVKTHSPLFYLHVALEQGARFGLPQGYTERAIYLAKGSVEVAGRAYVAGQMLVFNTGADPVIIAREPVTLMLLGGEPLGERFIWWNFVSSRKERIEQAKHDWKEGKIVLPPNDNHEFVPLPEDRTRPAGSSPAPQAFS
ncbi:MAG: pirin family protein [Cyclobacteriaceae bacterium]|nr:pirin family protein [Cyclobacteriaceae bacterium]